MTHSSSVWALTNFRVDGNICRVFAGDKRDGADVNLAVDHAYRIEHGPGQLAVSAEDSVNHTASLTARFSAGNVSGDSGDVAGAR